MCASLAGCGSNESTAGAVAPGSTPQDPSSNEIIGAPGGGASFGGATSAGGSLTLGPPSGTAGYYSGGGRSSSTGGASAGQVQPPPPLVGAPDAGAAAPPPAVPAVVNPFTVVAHDPLSTFAADVDTASYDLFVRDIGYGHLPDPNTVRTEEYVNFFGYAYPPPAPTAAEPFSISLAAAPTVFADGTTTLRVGIQGKAPPPFVKKPTNLVFLIDVSGSMQTAEKLPLVQYLVVHALDILAPTDTVSVVTYASGTRIALEPTPAGDKTTIAGVVNGLSAGGSTNGAGGIQLAYQEAESAFIQDGINHVILCTDGDFNVGVSSTTELVSLITEKRRTGITLTALGFGAGAINDSMMEAVSNAGNGIYSVISSEEQASRYIESRLLSTIVHIAKDVKIQVEFNPAQVYAYRLIGYEDRAIADNQFRNDIVDAGEVGAGHRVTALYQLVLAGGTIPVVTGGAPLDDGMQYDGAVEVAPSDLVLVKVRYKAPNAAETDPAAEVAVPLAATAVHQDLQGADADLQWAASVAALAEILRGSPYARRDALGTMASLIDANASLDSDRSQFRTLFGTARTLLGP
ncbi:MAG TPA: von Willebrand factor type A domain-containing protein [Gemmataceae bacterium]|nr:von Willebrand factor type A domain-containing protein [Gemmataceae bacterium]